MITESLLIQVSGGWYGAEGRARCGPSSLASKPSYPCNPLNNAEMLQELEFTLTNDSMTMGGANDDNRRNKF